MPPSTRQSFVIPWKVGEGKWMSFSGANRFKGISDVKRGYKTYELSNHLGNVLATVSDRRVCGTCTDSIVDFDDADILTISDYYPFGMTMQGRTQYAEKYRFGFGGQEKDDEWQGSGNAYEFKYRIYDPRLGRFLSTDPLFKSYPFISPYAFAQNSPIKFIELEGLEIAVAGTAADDFITLLANRTGLELTKDANGILTYAYTWTPKLDEEGKLQGFEKQPKFTKTDGKFVSLILRLLVIKAIDGGNNLEPVMVIAMSSDEIKAQSKSGIDEVAFDQFTGMNPNSPNLDNVIDMTDFENIGSAPILQGALLGHIITERSTPKYGKDGAAAFDIGHPQGIRTESSIVRESTGIMNPDLSIGNRIIANELNRKYSQKALGGGKSTGGRFDYGGKAYQTTVPTSPYNPNEIKGAIKVE